ncbi:MAG: hypothetical protein RMY28_022760 [Nostoc sp. ChiSLP01]
MTNQLLEGVNKKPQERFDRVDIDRLIPQKANYPSSCLRSSGSYAIS